MKAFPKAGLFGLLLACIPVLSFGLITSRHNNLVGKFYVSSVKGIVTCISDGKILELKKGDAIVARGTVIETPAGGNLTIVFSNGTGAFVEEKTHLEIEKFDQEFFTPNNNLRVEPSNSSTVVRVNNGRLLIGTPRLLSGTTMVYETPHAAINVKGEKVLLEVSSKQTHVAMIAGNASVVPRGPDGTFVSLGRHLKTGEEAFVKRTVGSATDRDDDNQVAAKENKPPASKTANANGTAAIAKTKAPSAPQTNEAEISVVKVTGFAHGKPNNQSAEMPLSVGSKFGKGATISSGDASEVHLQIFPGAIATLRPKTTVEIEQLAITTQGSTVKKRTALLALKSGTVFSTIDPAGRNINDYGVRTPRGIATAHGTSFAVSVDDESLFVAVTADSVTFTTSAGVSYEISSGRVSITPAGGQPQPPITLAQAAAGNPAFVAVIQNSVSVVAEVVQNNLGNLSASSATNLLAKVANTAAAALPNQAAAFETQLATAITSPTSATAGSAAVTLSAVTQALVLAAPAQATAIATSGATAAPAQANVVAAAAAKEVPAQAAQIASAVTQTLVRVGADGTVSPTSVQAAASLAAAVTTSAPGQAAPVAAAVLQALALSSPQTPPQATTLEASAIAAAVTAAAPSQAVPVASAMMKVVVQTPTMVDAPGGVVAQAAASLAASVTSVVPPQAQPVATAVMQLLIESQTNPAPSAIQDAAGLIAAAVTQVAPTQSDAVATGLANATNQSAAAVQTSAVLSTGDAAQVASIVSQATQVGSSAAQQGASSAAAVNLGYVIAVSASGANGNGIGPSGLANNGSGSSGDNSGTGKKSNIVDNSGTAGSGQGSSSSGNGSSGSSGTGNSSSVASNNGANGNGTGGTGSSGTGTGGSSTGTGGNTGGTGNGGTSGGGDSSSVASNGGTGNGTGGSSSSGGTSGNGSGGSSNGGDSSIIVVNNGTGGSGTGGSSSGGGDSSSGIVDVGSTGAGSSSSGGGTGPGSSGSSGGESSIVVVDNGGTGSGAGVDTGGGTGASGGGSGDETGNKSTSIIVTQFDPNEFNGVMNGLGAVQAAQSGVQFSSDTTGTTVTPLPTIPPTLPPDFVVSSANQ